MQLPSRVEFWWADGLVLGYQLVLDNEDNFVLTLYLAVFIITIFFDEE